MYKQYIAQVSIREQISLSIFLIIASNVKSSDYQSITCVDYVLGNLVNDSIGQMQDIIEWLFLTEFINKNYYSVMLGHARTF